jgi:hypothetical protein
MSGRRLFALLAPLGIAAFLVASAWTQEASTLVEWPT